MAGDDYGFDANTKRAFAIHEAMMAWLRENFPNDNPFTILAACTYEIGRIVAVIGSDMTDAEREHVLTSVFDVMRAQVKSGLKR